MNGDNNGESNTIMYPKYYILIPKLFFSCISAQANKRSRWVIRSTLRVFRRLHRCFWTWARHPNRFTKECLSLTICLKSEASNPKLQCCRTSRQTPWTQFVFLYKRQTSGYKWTFITWIVTQLLAISAWKSVQFIPSQWLLCWFIVERLIKFWLEDVMCFRVHH